MPSSGEGFGIVYLEAMACGLGVIAGNKDGSTDALKNGELGQLINPESIEQIANAMLRSLQNPLHTIDKQKIQQQVLHYFGFESFKQNTKEVFVKYE
jgi:glycosyltransferase involved in cell wall biosynthesis